MAEDEDEKEGKECKKEEEEINSYLVCCFFWFRAPLRLSFDSSYPDPSGCFLPQSTNHILYSAVFCETSYFWLTSEQETVLSASQLGRELEKKPERI